MKSSVWRCAALQKYFCPVNLCILAGMIVVFFLVSKPVHGQTLQPTQTPSNKQTISSSQEGCSVTGTAPCSASNGPAAISRPLNLQYFTANSPTKDEIESYLKAVWGYDPNREWNVAAILSTPVPNLERVVVVLADKSGKTKPKPFMFFVLPDGKHVVSVDEYTGVQLGGLGSQPYAEYRDLIQRRADGPFRGATSKSLEIVEFADFACPHCGEMQQNIAKLAADVPSAHIVFEIYPLSLAPASTETAAYGLCVDALGNNDAFFRYAAYIFSNQAALYSPPSLPNALSSAVTSVGLDPGKISQCAVQPSITEKLNSSIRLGRDLGVVRLPTLVINGRIVPGDVPYDTLLAIVKYEATLAGTN